MKGLRDQLREWKKKSNQTKKKTKKKRKEKLSTCEIEYLMRMDRPCYEPRRGALRQNKWRLCASHIVEIGFTLSPEYQGNGYGTEAVCALLNYIFHSLRKHKVIAFSDRISRRRQGFFL